MAKILSISRSLKESQALFKIFDKNTIIQTQNQIQYYLTTIGNSILRDFHHKLSTTTTTTTPGTETPDTTEPIPEDDIGHATGIEREELLAAKDGIDIFEEKWLSAPFGTIENPVEVTSCFSERIVGVTDPDDDCITMWGVIREGEPPKQIIEGGEYFVLKRIPLPDWAKDDD